jgi:hypothetical protein
MSKQNKGDKLIPNGTDGTVPNHTITSDTVGPIAIDQQAIVHNPKTCKAIFEEGMASGLFDTCKNAAQVNALISKIKNGGKTPTPYFVSEVSHAYTLTETGWVKRSDAEAHADVEITHVHLNDGSVAGIRLKGRPVFSVQYHPEAGPGPFDSRYLFDRFVDHMQASIEQRLKSTRNA